MLEVLIWSLFVGSLGIDAVLVSGWLRWQENVVKTQEEEEEEILSNHETQDRLTGQTISVEHSVRSPHPLNRSSSPSANLSAHRQTKKPLYRPSIQTAAQKIPANAGQSSHLSRSHPQTVFNAYPPTPSTFEPENLTHSQPAVNSFNYPETIQESMYFTERKPTEWEYKIVRCHSDLFRDPSHFRQLCEEELQAGWSLLEKLDDRRVRFKRSIEIRDNIDVNQLTFDPYRSHYGSPQKLIPFVGAIAAIAAIVLPAYLGYTLVSQTLQESNSKTSQTQAPLDLSEPTFQPPQIP